MPGFKPAVWAVGVQAVGVATTEGVKNTLLQCKTCYHRVSVHTLFMSICLPNISSSRPSTRPCGPCAGFLGGKGGADGDFPPASKSHNKAKKIMTKSSPLFDDLAELCNVVIVMGVGAFRGTGETSNEQDAEGSDEEEEEEEDYEEWAISESQLCLRSQLFPRIGI